MVFRVPYCRDSILGLLDMFYFLGKLIAYAPYTREKDSTGEYVYKVCPLDWSNIPGLIIVTGLSLWTSYYLYIYEFRSKGVDMGTYLLIIHAYSSSLSNVLISFNYFTKQESFLEGFYTMVEVDKKFKLFNLNFSCRKLHIFCLFFATGAIVILISYELYYEYYVGVPFSIQYIDTLCYCIGYCVREWAVFYFFSFMCLVAVRMKFLNIYLTNLTLKTLDKEEFTKKICLASDLHYMLCHISQCINHALSFPMLASIFMTSTLILLFTFTFFGCKEDMQGQIAFFLLVNIVPTWVVMVVGTYISYESRCTASIVCGLKIPYDEEVTVLTNNALLQLSHLSIEFNAAELFPLGVKIIFQHINTMTSLIMFLLEMKKHN